MFEGRNALVRRIISLVTVAALMAAMLAIGAGPASAQPCDPIFCDPCDDDWATSCYPPTTKEQCKAGKNVFKETGEPFKNPGQCIKGL